MTIASVYYILTICQVRANAGRAAAGGGDMDKHFQDLDANAKINKFLSDYIDHVSFGASTTSECMRFVRIITIVINKIIIISLLRTIPLLQTQPCGYGCLTCEIQGSAVGS